MDYDPRSEPHGLAHDPGTCLVVPRPIGWITTLNPAGVVNLAPYSFFNIISTRRDEAGNYQAIHVFNTAGFGPEGMHPEAGLLRGSSGSLYGTNTLDGLPIFSPNVKGTLFRMNENGAVAVLHTFRGPDGATPFAGLVEASDGNLYGTTFAGGASDKGTIFRINPRAPSSVVAST